MRINSITSETVRKLFDRYAYYFYVVKCFQNVKCTCLNPVTKDADIYCDKCLGTGYKIQIYKVLGCVREHKEREISVAQNVSSSPKVIYIKGLLRLEKDDLIIDDENVYHVLSLQWHRGEHGEFAFTRALCPYTKSNDAPLIRNFYRLLDGYKIRRKK